MVGWSLFAVSTFAAALHHYSDGELWWTGLQIVGTVAGLLNAVACSWMGKRKGKR